MHNVYLKSTWGVITMKFIQVARESVSMYKAMGVKGNTDLQEILAVIIGAGATPENCGKLAYLGTETLSQMTVEEFQGEGLSRLQGIQLKGAFALAEIANQVDKKKKRHTIRSPEDAANYMIDEIGYLNQEHFVVMALDTKSHVIGAETVFKGGLNAAIVHPREVFKFAVKKSAASLILFHNHPSGITTPSDEDIQITKRLVSSGETMGINVLDHVIVAGNSWLSLKSEGYM